MNVCPVLRKKGIISTLGEEVGEGFTEEVIGERGLDSYFDSVQILLTEE